MFADALAESVARSAAIKTAEEIRSRGVTAPLGKVERE